MYNIQYVSENNTETQLMLHEAMFLNIRTEMI